MEDTKQGWPTSPLQVVQLAMGAVGVLGFAVAAALILLSLERVL